MIYNVEIAFQDENEVMQKRLSMDFLPRTTHYDEDLCLLISQVREHFQQPVTRAPSRLQVTRKEE